MYRIREYIRVVQLVRICGNRTAAAGAATAAINRNGTFQSAPMVPPKRQQSTALRLYSSQNLTASSLDSVTYDRVCSQTLDALSDYFEELTEQATNLTGTDVAYSDGVLTVNFGQTHGIYVINRQTPNKQIWLSSPTSGPKRFDFVSTDGGGGSGKWIYRHSGESLHELLQFEIGEIIKEQPVDFMQLPYCS